MIQNCIVIYLIISCHVVLVLQVVAKCLLGLETVTANAAPEHVFANMGFQVMLETKYQMIRGWGVKSGIES